MLTVFVVLLLICVRESSAYVNSYVVMTSTLLTGCVYVFYNRPRNRIKLLHWERCGFVVYHKQMAQGCLSGKIMQQAAGFYELRWDELVLYMEGINPRCYRRKRYNKL